MRGLWVCVLLACACVSASAPLPRYAALSGYDVTKDKPYHMRDYIATDAFLRTVNVAAVHSKDAAYMYHTVRITRKNGRTGVFQVWDVCANADCLSKTNRVGCCDENIDAAVREKQGFLAPRSRVATLFDLDVKGAARALGVRDAASDSAGLLEVARFEVLGKFDRAKYVRDYGLKAS